jgi:flagellar protein FliS
MDSEVLSADPIKLVQLLYREALDSISGARRALAAGDIPNRSRLITKASAILNELALSLDHSKYPDLCSNLVELYDYMLRRLIDANTQQIDPPLVEVEGLLGGLFTAWQQAAQSEESRMEANCPSQAYAPRDSEHREVCYA